MLFPTPAGPSSAIIISLEAPDFQIVFAPLFLSESGIRRSLRPLYGNVSYSGAVKFFNLESARVKKVSDFTVFALAKRESYDACLRVFNIVFFDFVADVPSTVTPSFPFIKHFPRDIFTGFDGIGLQNSRGRMGNGFCETLRRL